MDDCERLVEDRRREGSHQDLVEFGQLVELLDESTVLAWLVQQDRLAAVPREPTSEPRLRQPDGFLADRWAGDLDSCPLQCPGGIEHARGVPPAGPAEMRPRALLRPRLAD